MRGHALHRNSATKFGATILLGFAAISNEMTAPISSGRLQVLQMTDQQDPQCDQLLRFEHHDVTFRLVAQFAGVLVVFSCRKLPI